MAISTRLSCLLVASWLLGASLVLTGCDPSDQSTLLAPGGEPGVSVQAGEASLEQTSRGRHPKPNLTSLLISPDTAVLHPQEKQSFTAKGTRKNGTLSNVEVTWSATGGVIDASGTFVAGATYGRYYVRGTSANGFVDSAAIDISAATDSPAVVDVLISPKSATVPTGGTQAFTAAARLSDSSSAPIDVTFSATGGTVSTSGLYKAGGTPGTYRVIAASATGLADTSTITVVPSELQEVVLTPASVSLTAGATQQFAASGGFSDGTTEPVSVTFTAAGGTISAAGLYTAGMSAGSYRVIATAASGPADTSTVTITVPSGDTGELAAQADSFVNSMSVQTHLGYTNSIYYSAWSSIIRPRLLELGVRHVRERMGTNSTVISRFKDLAANGIKLTAGCWPEGGVMIDASQCIAKANAHGTGTIDAFDGWNEVDNTAGDWATNWVKWQTALYQAYKADATWRNRPVLGNSFAGASSADAVGDRHTILDYGNLHSYPAGGLPSNVSNSWIPQWNKVANPKPHWVTETGYHNCLTCFGNGVSPRASGKYYSRLWFEYFNRGIRRTNAYELIDLGVSTSERSMNWGLLYHDGRPKPQFTATKNLIALLRDDGSPFVTGRLDYTLSGDLTAVHHTLLQKRDGRFYLALWLEVSVWNTSSKTDVTNAERMITLNLSRPASAINVYRPVADTRPVQTGNGASIALRVPDEVMLVEIIP